jgi:DNA topoisomerase-3
VKELEKSQDGFGEFATKVCSGEMYMRPRNGKSDDKAHPPIHPVKIGNKNDLGMDEWRIYEFICRHFLASISKDAIGSETKVDLEMGGERFSTKGLIIE